MYLHSSSTHYQAPHALFMARVPPFFLYIWRGLESTAITVFVLHTAADPGLIFGIPNHPLTTTRCTTSENYVRCGPRALLDVTSNSPKCCQVWFQNKAKYAISPSGEVTGLWRHSPPLLTSLIAPHSNGVKLHWFHKAPFLTPDWPLLLIYH